MKNNELKHQIVIVVLMMSVMVMTYLIFQAGFSGIFLLDDEPNLSPLNLNGGITSIEHASQFVLGNSSGVLGRPISMLSFLIEDQYWPGDAALYKRNNLYFHIISGFVVFLISVLLLSVHQPSKKNNNNYISLIVLLFWLVNPLHVSTVLYVIQRMTLLMSFFTLLAILFYLLGRITLAKDTLKSYLFFFLAATSVILSVGCKENGILALTYIAVIEFTILRDLPKTRVFKYAFKLLIVAPVILLFCYFTYNWENYLQGYINRDFTLLERVLTESRVLVEYLYRIIIPQSGGGGLIHDDIVISTGLFSPVTTLISLCFHVGLLCFSWLARDKLRVFSFAVLWFYVGHLLESTFIALELYFEHRNYLPMIGPIFALVYYAVEWCVKVTAKGKFVICTAGILIIVISCLITKQASTIWGEPSVLFRVWANEHPNSPRANRIYGQLLGVEGEYQKAIVQLVQTNQKFPYDAGVLIDAMNIACKNDMQPPFTMLFLRQKILKAHYTDGLTYYVDRMFENVVDGSCSYVNEEVFFEIIDMLIELPRMTGPLSSKVLLLKAKFYIRNKKLNDAMSVLEQAYILYPNPILALLQSKLMLSAGIIEKATYYLDIADKSSQKNTFKNVALRAEIKAVKIQLENYRY